MKIHVRTAIQVGGAAGLVALSACQGGGDSAMRGGEPVAIESPSAAADGGGVSTVSIMEPSDGQCIRLATVGGAAIGPVESEKATSKDDGSVYTRYRSGKHIVDTPLPVGYPAPTPPGAIELKRYPVVRRAEVSRKDDPDGILFGMMGGKNAGFWPLFRHIQSRNIAMTAPVETDIPGTGDNKDEAWRMAFLYRTPDLGPEGKAERGVVVKDLPPMTVLSLGVSGNSGADSAEQSLEVLRRWLDAHPEWKEVRTSPSPPPRVLNYNDPFTRPQWSEVQVVVERGV